jgi:hypothetical protein
METFSKNISDIKVGSKLLGQFPVEVIEWNGKTAKVRALGNKSSFQRFYSLRATVIQREISNGYMGIANID